MGRSKNWGLLGFFCISALTDELSLNMWHLSTTEQEERFQERQLLHPSLQTLFRHVVCSLGFRLLVIFGWGGEVIRSYHQSPTPRQMSWDELILHFKVRQGPESNTWPFAWGVKAEVESL